MAKKHRKFKSTKNTWLFCEGKTERNYFLGLISEERIGNVKIKDTTKTDPLGLLEEAIKFKQSQHYFKEDTYYCIFDRDYNSEDILKKVVEMAKKYRIELIFSNPCFEYWILCHFEKHADSIEMNELLIKLKQHLKKYEKGDNDIYNKIKSKTDNAIRYAKEIRKKHSKLPRLISKKSNPCTDVYTLVGNLLSKK